ncbi:MAG: hypothetical protein H7Y38_11610 [Armatimonadetes bacterium]|nr:hypothetical protein [Armatimonadota bacterium]
MSDEPLGADVANQGFIGTLTGETNAHGEPILRWWSIGRLWRLADALPYTETPLEELNFVLDNHSNLVACLDGRALLNRDVAEKARRIWEADLNYPIILIGDQWIADGSHRVMKAHALGLPTIRVVRFAVVPVPDFVRSREDFIR